MIIIVIKKMRKLIINFFLKDRKFPSVFVVLQISTLTLGKIKIEKQVWLKSEKELRQKTFFRVSKFYQKPLRILF